MRLLKATIISLFLLGCDTPQQRERNWIQSYQDNLAERLSYFKDDRMNGCFAGSGVGSREGLLTNVPCTPEIDKAAYHFTSRR